MIYNSKIYWRKHCQYKSAQNANIREISDEQGTETKYEIVYIHFVIGTTQNSKEDFDEEMKTSQIIDTALSKTVKLVMNKGLKPNMKLCTYILLLGQLKFKGRL